MEGVKINQESRETEKMKTKLQRIAKTRLSKNRADPEAWHLLAYLEELNGKRQPAEETSERSLDSGCFVPSASLTEE